MPTQGPHFNFYQAPPGPDSSRQYSDWQNAILAQGEAFNEPLRLLLKGMIEGKLQDKRIRAAKEERADERDYQKTRDAAADARFQQDFALRQGAEDRQVQKEQYDRAQGNADVGLLLDMLAPKNSVEKLSPQYQQLQQLRGPEVPLSPLAQPVAPHASVMDDAIREAGRAQIEQQKQQAASERTNYISNALVNGAAMKILTPNDLKIAQSYLSMGNAEGEAKALDMLAKGQENGKKLAGRAEQFSVLETYAKEHPDDPKVKAYLPSLETLRPGLKRADIEDSFWNTNFNHAYEQMTGTEKASTKTPKGPTFDDPLIGKQDVPDFVAQGGDATNGLPPQVERWIADIGFARYQKDKKLEGLEGAALTSEEKMQIQQQHTAAVRQAVMDQFGWKVQPPLPYGNAGDQQAGAQPTQPPSNQVPAPMQPQQSVLSTLPPEAIMEAHRLLDAGDEAGARAVLLKARTGDSAAFKKTEAAAPEPKRRDREPSRGPF